MLIAAPPWCSSAILAMATPDRSPSHRADVRTVSSKEPKGPAPPRALPHRFVALRCQSKHRGIAPRFHIFTLAIGRLPHRPDQSASHVIAAARSPLQDGLVWGRDLISPGGQRQDPPGWSRFFWTDKGTSANERAQRASSSGIDTRRPNHSDLSTASGRRSRPSSPRSGVFSMEEKRMYRVVRRAKRSRSGISRNSMHLSFLHRGREVT